MWGRRCHSVKKGTNLRDELTRIDNVGQKGRRPPRSKKSSGKTTKIFLKGYSQRMGGGRKGTEKKARERAKKRGGKGWSHRRLKRRRPSGGYEKKRTEKAGEGRGGGAERKKEESGGDKSKKVEWWGRCRGRGVRGEAIGEAGRLDRNQKQHGKDRTILVSRFGDAEWTVRKTGTRMFGSCGQTKIIKGWAGRRTTNGGRGNTGFHHTDTPRLRGRGLTRKLAKKRGGKLPAIPSTRGGGRKG